MAEWKSVFVGVNISTKLARRFFFFKAVEKAIE